MAKLHGVVFALWCWCSSPIVDAATFEIPEALGPDVAFWVRIYAELSSREGFIHDAESLIVYERLTNLPPELAEERRETVTRRTQHYRDRLQRLAMKGATITDAEDGRILDLLHARAGDEQTRRATRSVRFQSGQADRFRQGLERAGHWRTHIEHMLAEAGMPPELAALPHVESAYDPLAYSKSGAAGLWQLMRPAARPHLRIDDRVDERFDPLASTAAAIQYLRDAHDRLGSWPLAVVSYNHGVNGTVRAKTRLGTTDIVRVLREYDAPSFKFASRNFYPSFLAALEVERRAAQFFGEIAPAPRWQTCRAPLQVDVEVAEVAAAVGHSAELLRSFNPALQAGVWGGDHPVPAGYALRLPAEALRPEARIAWLAHEAWRTELPEVQPVYVVRPGDNLTRVSAAFATSLRELVALNDIARPDILHVGQRLRVRGAPECVGRCACANELASPERSPVTTAEHTHETTPS